MAVGDTTTSSIEGFLTDKGQKHNKPPHSPKPPKSKPTKPPKPITRSITTREYGKMDIEASTPTISPDSAIPTLSGRQRLLSPNVIWYGNYRTKYEYEMREETRTVTEKTMLDRSGYEYEDREVLITEKKHIYTPVDYYITVVVALAHGPHVELKGIYSDAELIWSGDTLDGRNEITLTSDKAQFKRAIFYSGEFDQAPSQELIDLLGEDNVNAMVGTAYLIIPTIASKDYGSGGFSFELERSKFDNELAPGYRSAKGDINAVQMLYDIMLNDWSGLALPASYIDTASWLSVYAKAAARNYYLSYLDKDGSYGSSYIEMICGLCGFVIYVEPTTEKIIIREYHTDNYNAGIALSFNDDDIVKVQEFERPDWSEMPTHFVLEFSDRENNYQQESFERLNYSVNQDDQRTAQDKVIVKAMIAADRNVALGLLTRTIMHTGAPVFEMDIVTNTKGGRCRPGDAIKISVDQYDFVDEPYWITNVVNTDNDLNQVQLKGFFFTRYDVGDFNDAPVKPVWVKPDTSPVKPVLAEILNTEIPLNMLMRQGVIKRYDGDQSQYYPYAMILARAENDQQISLNVHKNDDGALVKSRMSYCASGFLSEGFSAVVGQVNGFVGDVEIDDATYLHIVDNEGGIAYAKGEWFKFASVTKLPNGRARIERLERGLWGTTLVEHLAGDIFWMMDDADRRFGPFRKNLQRSFTLVPIAADRPGIYPNDGLVVGPKLMAENVAVANNPVQVSFNGTRWYSDDVPTIYLDTDNTLKWQNVHRRTTTANGILDNIRTRERNVGNQKDIYIAMLFWFDEFGAEQGTSLGKTGADEDPASDFRFQRLVFNLNSGDFAPGEYRIELVHKIGSALSKGIVIPFIVAELPGLILDVKFDFGKRFNVELRCEYAIISIYDET